MSFYSSLLYYRPCKPPRITGRDLARFVTAVKSLGILQDAGYQHCNVKFGSAIDQDDGNMDASVEVLPGLRTIAQKKWDLDKYTKSLDEIIRLLEPQGESVYRAHLGFGRLIDPVAEAISRVDSPENEINFTPCDLALEFGPVRCAMLGSDEIWQVGWIKVSLHGYGYLWPWTFRELIARAEGLPEISRLTDLCRTFWPIEAEQRKVGEESIAQRKEMGQLWPYDEIDRPWDWFWGVSET